MVGFQLDIISFQGTSWLIIEVFLVFYVMSLHSWFVVFLLDVLFHSGCGIMCLGGWTSGLVLSSDLTGLLSFIFVLNGGGGGRKLGFL